MAEKPGMEARKEVVNPGSDSSYGDESGLSTSFHWNSNQAWLFLMLEKTLVN
jgi:hypothetical protein